MKTKAATLWGPQQKWEVEEVDLDGSKQDPTAGVPQQRFAGLFES